MFDLNVLREPAVLITVGAVFGLAVILTLAVRRNLQNPAKRANFDEAMRVMMSSELEIDTALNKGSVEKAGWFEYWARKTDKTGRIVSDRSTPGRVALGLVVFGLLFGVLVFPGGVFGVIAGPVFLLVFKLLLDSEVRKRITAMEKQLPQMLSGMRASLQAGSTAQQAIINVAEDLPSPLGDEMRILQRDLQVAVALDQALLALALRVPSREMQFLVASVEIAIRSGADLDPQLETIQEIVSQRTRIRQKLAGAVAQVKPTKLLAVGAVPLMFFVSLRTPENQDYWFGKGLFILVIAAILYVTGTLVIRAMIKSVENT